MCVGFILIGDTLICNNISLCVLSGSNLHSMSEWLPLLDKFKMHRVSKIPVECLLKRGHPYKATVSLETELLYLIMVHFLTNVLIW
jgi:hypothetical protein